PSMMIPTTAIPGILVTSFVPGYLLYRMVMPQERIRDPLTFVKMLVLSILFSIAAVSVLGVALGFIPHGSTGFFAPLWVVLGITAMSVAFFWVGLRRGAYPHLRRVHVPEPGPLSDEPTLGA
ncbi:MAG: hypothetical protein ACYDDF_09445, partial [Thermoplasmatota archaeon]